MLDRTFVTLNFIGFILPLITLPWHLEQKVGSPGLGIVFYC